MNRKLDDRVDVDVPEEVLDNPVAAPTDRNGAAIALITPVNVLAIFPSNFAASPVGSTQFSGS
jgi:hypothetical protein